MNKKIKKKKAKQDLQRDQERVNQELAKLSPEELEDLVRTINQVLQEIGKVIAYIFDGLVDFFKNMEESFESIEQQGTIQSRPRALQVQRHRQSHLGKKSGAHVQQWGRNCRKSWRRYQQANRKHGHQTKHRRSTKKPRAIQRNR